MFHFCVVSYSVVAFSRPERQKDMGPNSGGGRRNQGKANVATRARFSKAPKKLLENIKKKGIDREVRKHVDSKQGSGRGSTGSSSSSSCIRDIPLDKKKVEQKGLERLNLPQHLLTKLLTLFEGPRPEEKAPTVRAPQTNSKPPTVPSDATQSTVQIATSEIPLKRKDDVPFSLCAAPVNKASKENKASPRGQTLHSIFTKYGFTANEIKTIVKSNKCSSDNEQFLALLILSREHALPTPADVSKSPLPVSQNEELNGEIEVLKSIYDNVFHENFEAFGFLPCCRISVLIEIDDIDFEIRMFIFNADQYPNKHSKLYGWLIDPTAITLKKASGVTHATCLSAESMRQVSVAAMEKIQYHHVQVEAPVAFDFIQTFNEAIPEQITLLKAGATTSAKRNGPPSGQKKDGAPTRLPIKKTNGSNSNNSDDSKAVTVTTSDRVSAPGGKGQKASKGKKQAPAAEVEELFPKRPKLPPMPVTFFIKSPEYRSAYGAALSKGLERSAAQVLVPINYIMPIQYSTNSVIVV